MLLHCRRSSALHHLVVPFLSYQWCITIPHSSVLAFGPTKLGPRTTRSYAAVSSGFEKRDCTLVITTPEERWRKTFFRRTRCSVYQSAKDMNADSNDDDDGNGSSSNNVNEELPPTTTSSTVVGGHAQTYTNMPIENIQNFLGQCQDPFQPSMVYSSDLEEKFVHIDKRKSIFCAICNDTRLFDLIDESIVRNIFNNDEERKFDFF